MYELSEPKESNQIHTTPGIAMAIFSMVFVGVVRGLLGSIFLRKAKNLGSKAIRRGLVESSFFEKTAQLPKGPGMEPHRKRLELFFPELNHGLRNHMGVQQMDEKIGTAFEPHVR